MTSPRSLSRPPLSRALAVLVERGVQSAQVQQLVGAAHGERRCGIVPLSRRSGSDWEGEGNDRRSWGEVLPARGAEGFVVGEQYATLLHCAPLPKERWRLGGRGE